MVRHKISRRLAASLACAAAMAILAGCGSSSGSGGGSGGKGTIAFVLSGPDLYYQAGLHGAEAAAKKLGYSVKVYPNPNISPSVEFSNVQNAIAAGVKAIDMYPVGLSTESASLSKAASANVPIFVMYGYSPKLLHDKDVIGFEQTTLAPYGHPMGVYLKKQLPAGSQVAVITGQLGRGDAEGYRTGFLQGLGCQGNTTSGTPPMTCSKGIKYVDTETGHWLRPAAYTAAQDIIGKYPNLGGVFVENEDMAVGAHTAFKAAHKSPLIVSQNGAPYGLAGIKAGWLAATDTVAPSLEGLDSVRLIDAYLHHKISGNKLYISYTKFVDKKTVNKAVGWNFYKDPAQVTHWMSQPLPKPDPNPSSYR